MPDKKPSKPDERDTEPNPVDDKDRDTEPCPVPIHQAGRRGTIGPTPTMHHTAPFSLGLLVASYHQLANPAAGHLPPNFTVWVR